ncbi:hypothetical protein [Archangium sp.]|uniref:hypothetical protein n=1 Tax=Archangium sp. TaxID=1872627 RepID=UPI002D3050A0|nr:hypothetical protein [Archangium sp.]HYO54471.1 hypothetical protein [Archangium sp.]
MLALKPHHESRFQEDMYKLQVRSGYSQLMLNSGYTGVRIVSCPSGESLERIAFPETIENFTLDAWLVSPDGRTSYLFSRDETFALEIDFQSKAVRKISLSPQMAPPTGLCWFTPGLRIWDQHRNEWRLDHERFMPVKDEKDEKDGAQAEEKTRRFRQALSRLAGFTVLKMSARWQGFYVLSDDGGRIGYIPLNGDALLISQDGSAIDVAHHEDELFVCFENEIAQYAGGNRSTALKARPDEFFLAVQILEAEEAAYLCVLASTQDQATSILKFYQLLRQP